MIVSYRQDDGTSQRVDLDDLSAIEAAGIESVMDGIPWHGVERLLRGQDPTAMRAVLWAVRRRSEPGLDFATFDVPGFRRRLTARIDRAEIDDFLQNLMSEALAASEDSAIDEWVPQLRSLADDPADVDAALDALGKGHSARPPKASKG